MTLYGYARVSVREPEDKNLDLQVERLVRAGCSMGNVRAEEASGAKDDRGGLLELLDLVVEGDTLVVTHIDRLSRGLTYGLQVIEGLHLAGVEFRSLAEVSRAMGCWASGAEQKCTTREVISQRNCPRQLFGTSVTEAGWQQAGRVSEDGFWRDLWVV